MPRKSLAESSDASFCSCWCWLGVLLPLRCVCWGHPIRTNEKAQPGVGKQTGHCENISRVRVSLGPCCLSQRPLRTVPVSRRAGLGLFFPLTAGWALGIPSARKHAGLRMQILRPGPPPFESEPGFNKTPGGGRHIGVTPGSLSWLHIRITC